MEQVKVKIQQGEVKRYKEGFPLITKDALVNPEVLTEEGQLLEVTDEWGQFIGNGYYGEQNKGAGWIITRQAPDKINQQLIDRLVSKAVGIRQAYYEDTAIDAFRVFNGEGDGFGGVIIDYYKRYYVIHFYSEGAYQFKEFFVDSLLRNTDAIGIYEKKRFAKEGQYVEDDDFVTGEEAPSPLIVNENNVNIAVYLNDGAMVGFFHDQRDVRKVILEKYAKGRTVLNTFSYTGVFSVFAALGGSLKTTNVDAANRSKEKTAEQFAMNQLDPEDHDIIVDDAFQFLKRTQRRERTFGLVILDPPSFARTKKTTFSARKDYAKLLVDAIHVTEDNGIIVAALNHAGVAPQRFRKTVGEAFQNAGVPFRVLESFGLPGDFKTDEAFKEGKYLKVLVLQRKDS